MFARHVDPAEVEGAEEENDPLASAAASAAVGYAVWDSLPGRQGIRKPSTAGKPGRRGDAPEGRGVR